MAGLPHGSGWCLIVSVGLHASAMISWTVALCLKAVVDSRCWVGDLASLHGSDRWDFACCLPGRAVEAEICRTMHAMQGAARCELRCTRLLPYVLSVLLLCRLEPLKVFSSSSSCTMGCRCQAACQESGDGPYIHSGWSPATHYEESSHSKILVTSLPHWAADAAMRTAGPSC